MNINQENENLNNGRSVNNRSQNEEERQLTKKEKLKQKTRQKRKETYRPQTNVKGTGKRLYDMFYAQNNLDQKHAKLRSKRATLKSKYKNGTEIRGMNKTMRNMFIIDENVENGNKDKNVENGNNISRKLTKAQLRKREARKTRKTKKNKHGLNKAKMGERLSKLFEMYNNEENGNITEKVSKKDLRFSSNMEYKNYLQDVFRDMPVQEGITNGDKERFIENIIVPEGKTLKQLRISLISQTSKLMKNVSQHYERIVSYLDQLRLLEQMIVYQESQGIELAKMKPKRKAVGATTRPPVNPAKPQRDCPEGQEASARTGRCIKKCVLPQVRNPQTGRCKKI